MTDNKHRAPVSIAAAILTLTAHAAPAAAENRDMRPETVKIGVIDTMVSPTSHSDMKVNYRYFGPSGQEEGIERVTVRKTHGDAVLDSISETRDLMKDKRPYEIYHANPFVRRSDGSLAASYIGMVQAVSWFKENGVKVVSTSFAAAVDSPGMETFKHAADEAGLTVIASVGNSGASMPFPAAYSSVIAIDGHYYRETSSPTRDAFLGRADAVFDGDTKLFSGYPGQQTTRVRGSSFAAAKASAFVAANLGDRATFEAAKGLLAKSYVEKGVPVVASLMKTPASSQSVETERQNINVKIAESAVRAAQAGSGY